MQQDIQAAKFAILKAIRAKSVDTTSALKLVADSMKIVEQVVSRPGKEKKEILLTCLREIAKGEDGIAGSKDDIINKNVIESLSVLLKDNLIEDVITFTIDLSKGKFDVKKLQSVSKSCFLCFSKQFSG